MFQQVNMVYKTLNSNIVDYIQIQQLAIYCKLASQNVGFHMHVNCLVPHWEGKFFHKIVNTHVMHEPHLQQPP